MTFSASQRDDEVFSLEKARTRPEEQARVADLMRMVPPGLASALDVGARDGYITGRLAGLIPSVTAIDLELPQFAIPRVMVERGDARKLRFPDEAFDLALCSEVLEHIPGVGLEEACRELIRVSRRFVLIGVPYRQDTRVGRMTCKQCGARNPPWGHVNVFDEGRLRQLFGDLRPVQWSYVGSSKERTNWLSTVLNDWAGNPWGPYEQEEPCVGCGAKLMRPGSRSVSQRLASRAAFVVNRFQQPFFAKRPAWVHVLFERC